MRDLRSPPYGITSGGSNPNQPTTPTARQILILQFVGRNLIRNIGAIQPYVKMHCLSVSRHMSGVGWLTDIVLINIKQSLSSSCRSKMTQRLALGASFQY